MDLSLNALKNRQLVEDDAELAAQNQPIAEQNAAIDAQLPPLSTSKPASTIKPDPVRTKHTQPEISPISDDELNDTIDQDSRFSRQLEAALIENSPATVANNGRRATPVFEIPGIEDPLDAASIEIGGAAAGAVEKMASEIEKLSKFSVAKGNHGTRKNPIGRIVETFTPVPSTIADTDMEFADSWTSRRKYFSDFYADPAQWPRSLALSVIEWYKTAKYPIPLIAIKAFRRKRRRGVATDERGLPIFQQTERLSSPRVIDVYAMLSTCMMIGMGKAFVGSPEHNQFAISQKREPINSLNLDHCEIPVLSFIPIYRAFVQNKMTFRGLTKVLASGSLALTDTQIKVVCGQISKSMRRRMLDIKKYGEPVAAPTAASAKDLYTSVQRTGMIIRCGEHQMLISQWPRGTNVSEMMLHNRKSYSLSEALRAFSMMGAAVEMNPHHDITEQFKSLIDGLSQ